MLNVSRNAVKMLQTAGSSDTDFQDDNDLFLNGEDPLVFASDWVRTWLRGEEQGLERKDEVFCGKRQMRM